jgi:hypothetical protein
MDGGMLRPEPLLREARAREGLQIPWEPSCVWVPARYLLLQGIEREREREREREMLVNPL